MYTLLQVDVIMGSDHLGTSLPAGDAGFEEPEFAFWHEYNSGAGPSRPLSLQMLQRLARALPVPGTAHILHAAALLPTKIHHG